MTAKALADELGPRGIRVFGLMPGTIATDRIDRDRAASGDAGRDAGAHRGRHPAAPDRPARRSSAGWPRSCSPPPPPTSPARCSPSTAASLARSLMPAPVLVACAHGTRNPTGRRLIGELALAARRAAAGPAHHGRVRRRPAADGGRRRGRPAAAGHARPSSSRCCCPAGTTCTSTSPARSPAHPSARRRRARWARTRGWSRCCTTGWWPRGADPADPRTAVVLAAAGLQRPAVGGRRRGTADAAAARLGRAGHHRLRLGRAAAGARRRRGGPARPARSGWSSPPTCWRPGTSPTSCRGRRRSRSPRHCCPTTGSPPSCSTATTRRCAATSRPRRAATVSSRGVTVPYPRT